MITLSKLTTANQLLFPGGQGIAQGAQMDARLFLLEPECD